MNMANNRITRKMMHEGFTTGEEEFEELFDNEEEGRDDEEDKDEDNLELRKNMTRAQRRASTKAYKNRVIKRAESASRNEGKRVGHDAKASGSHRNVIGQKEAVRSPRTGKMENICKKAGKYKTPEEKKEEARRNLKKELEVWESRRDEISSRLEEAKKGHEKAGYLTMLRKELEKIQRKIDELEERLAG